jgi:hypothetical protein
MTPEQQQAALEAAEQLKAEGNDLYRAKDHGAALEKYLAAADGVEAAAEAAAAAGSSADANADNADDANDAGLLPLLAACQAVYFANAAACALALSDWARAADLAGRALDLRPGYAKALMRRAAAREALDDPEGALADARRVAELATTTAEAMMAGSGDGGGEGNKGGRAAPAAGEAPSLPAARSALAATSAPPDRAARQWAGLAAARLEPLVAERQERMKAEVLGKLKDLGNSILGRFGMSVDDFRAEKDPSTGSYSIKFGKGGGGEGEE